MGVVFTQPIASHGGLNWDTNLEAALTELKAKANFADQTIPSSDLSQIVLGGPYYGSGLSNAPGGASSGFSVFTMLRPDGTTGGQLAIGNGAEGQLWVRRRTGGTWGAWYQVVTGVSDTGWITASTGITSVGNWTLNGSKYRNVNGVVALAVSLTRTASAITAANAAGITPGLGFAQLPAALTPNQTNGLLQTVGASSTVAASAQVTSAGLVNVTNLAPSQGIPVGGVLDMMGTYIL